MLVTIVQESNEENENQCGQWKKRNEEFEPHNKTHWSDLGGDFVRAHKTPETLGSKRSKYVDFKIKPIERDETTVR